MKFQSMKYLSAMAMILAAVAGGRAGELSVEDFKFDGPLGSAGARIEKVGRNDFTITVGHPPDRTAWPNHLQFQILRNAKGNDLHITRRFDAISEYKPFKYPYGIGGPSCLSYDDGKTWEKITWRKYKDKLDKNPDDKTATHTVEMLFPVFEQDTVWFGHEVPMSYEDMLKLVAGWKKNPAVKVQVIGQSLGKRDLIRMEVTDPRSPYPRAGRWVHYFANQHPGEYNAMWRMVGMIDWLLSDAGADTRKRFICHFIIMMSPDGPSAGWHRTNAQGKDMNRSYCDQGANLATQAHEAYLCQKDLESIMASDCPVTTISDMHTCGGNIRLRIYPGPETGNLVGPPSQLAGILTRLDPTNALVRPLICRGEKMPPRSKWRPLPPDKPPRYSEGNGFWDEGPRDQFGITAFEVEGGGSFSTKKEALDSGVVFIQALAEYYPGTLGEAGKLKK